jgi:hypothetical protein
MVLNQEMDPIMEPSHVTDMKVFMVLCKELSWNSSEVRLPVSKKRAMVKQVKIDEEWFKKL